MTSESVPPPVPASARRKLPTWAIVLIVVGAIGVAFVGVGVIGTASFVAKMQEEVRRETCLNNQMQEDVRRLTCMNNLSHHGQAYLVTARRKAPAHCGAALWVSFCKRIAADPRVLVCPADARARRPETAEDRARYEIVDLDHVPRDLCSYPGRDFEKFPIDPKSHDKQPIGACLSHKGGAPVIYADGRVEWLTLEKLGLDSDDDKIVGPDSKSPVLRVLRYGDGSVR